MTYTEHCQQTRDSNFSSITHVVGHVVNALTCRLPHRKKEVNNLYWYDL